MNDWTVGDWGGLAAGFVAGIAALGKVGVLPDFGSSLFAAYLLGTGFDPEGVHGATHDWSGNARTLVLGGTTAPGAHTTTLNKTNYATAPFTGDTLATANSSFTIGLVCKITTNSNPVNLINSKASPSSTARHVALESNSVNLYSQNKIEAGADNLAVISNAVAVDTADIASHYALRLATFTRTGNTVYRLRSDKPMLSAINSARADNAIGGITNFIIGGNYGGGTGGTISASAAFFYNRALTEAQIADELFPALVSLHAEYGITL